mmetsp:Transcript_9630/g.20946  ORF Transcript_9630/g.20946 Transcript_9630/m.20946 type:complete len:125 (+) Transcript_9630:1140-1514(+)
MPMPFTRSSTAPAPINAFLAVSSRAEMFIPKKLIFFLPGSSSGAGASSGTAAGSGAVGAGGASDGAGAILKEKDGDDGLRWRWGWGFLDFWGRRRARKARGARLAKLKSSYTAAQPAAANKKYT